MVVSISLSYTYNRRIVFITSWLSAVTKLAAIDTNPAEVDFFEAAKTYTQLFEFLMWVGIGSGVFLLLLSPILKRAMHGVR